MRTRIHAATVLALGLMACGPLTETTVTPASGNVDPFKELVIVDDAVIGSAAARNASDGALSFGHVMKQLAVRPEDASSVTLGWLATWAPASLTCTWLSERRENACDAGCNACSERTLDFNRAPFRLIAVTNRIDLSEPAGHVGEGRLVFAATEGPADEPSSAALPVTVIAEFRLSGERSAWATRWHALGSYDTFSAEYIQSLTDVAEGFVRAENLAQLRVNDAFSGSIPVMHEFHLDETNGRARLAPAGLRRTPVHALDRSAALHDLVLADEAQILADTHEVPLAMLADRVELGGRWELPGVDEPLRHAFAASTCDGCHGAEHPVLDGAFHISPLRQGRAKLSTFVFDPAHRETDDLTRRAAFLTKLIGSK